MKPTEITKLWEKSDEWWSHNPQVANGKKEEFRSVDARERKSWTFIASDTKPWSEFQEWYIGAEHLSYDKLEAHMKKQYPKVKVNVYAPNGDYYWWDTKTLQKRD